MEKVSFLMTVYNAEDTLKTTINSILEQTYKNIELIIVDDGSTDSSKFIIGKLAQNDSRIIFINRNENKGRVFSLNEALSYCNSNFIFINDSDDISKLNRAEKIMEYYEKIKINKVGIIGGAAITKYTKEKKEILKKKKKGRISSFRINIDNPFVHSSIMYKKEALIEIDGFDTTLTSSIDYFTILKIANLYDVFAVEDVLVTRQVTGKNFFMQKDITEKNKNNKIIIKKWIKNNVRFGVVYNIISDLITTGSNLKRKIFKKN